jgi:hypothetical protein
VVVTDPAAEAERVIQAVLRDLRGPGNQGVVVDSPPGAGKSTLVVRAARELVAEGGQVMIVAQTNEQVDDLVHRLALGDATLAIGRLSAAEYVPSQRVKQHTNIQVSADIKALRGESIVVGTAAKWAYIKNEHWPWAIVDEAYQMRSDMLLRIAGLFDRGLFVGDPGQLDPFSVLETERWRGLSWDPMQSAVAVLLRHNPGVAQHRLPVSWRLPVSAAEPVSRAFYPFAPFVSGTAADQRRLGLAAAALRSRPEDEAIETAVSSGWALYELPARHTLRTDSEAVAACVTIARRLLERGPVAHSPELHSSGEPVTASRIAIGAAHRDQAAALRAQLGDWGTGITVDTANRLQGREFDVTIVLHPLSGRRDATAFHLESGRLCVLTSRHRHACVVVARAGIQALLDAHPSTEPVHLNVPVKFPDGWEANQSILTHLQPYKMSSA